ncbi:MAG: hypothetical protein IPO83_02745 [Chitinophagaceae bacterium]|nr:hypothetical protein [Chitinophagaceae bacterium]
MKIPGFAGLMVIVMLCLHSTYTNAQALEIGIDGGVTGFLGDLGGANYIGRPFVFDLETSLLKPAASIHFRYYVGGLLTIKTSFTYTGIAGNDSLIQPTAQFSPEWYRWYRNLSFQSTLMEGAVTAELNFKHFEPGSKRYRFAPYILAGVGVMHFNPKTIYNGNLIELQPLHTEGQGFDSLNVKPYSLIQAVFPVGFGFRYNLTQSAILGFEFRNCFTMTDYMDDVSTSYASQDQFNNYFSDPATASLAYEISRRSDEKDPEEFYGYITAPGQQRGDANKDQYFMMQFSISYLLFNNSMSSSGFSGKHGIYAHRIKATHEMFNHSRGKQYYKRKSHR